MSTDMEAGAVPRVARYRATSDFFEAIQWTGENAEDVKAFCAPALISPAQLPTGYWLVRGSDKELRPVAAHVFAGLYEPAAGSRPALDRDRLVDLIGKRTAMYGFAAEDLADAILKDAEGSSDD